MLQDPKPPVNPKETSLKTYPDVSMKMYDISKETLLVWWIPLKKMDTVTRGHTLDEAVYVLHILRNGINPIIPFPAMGK